MAEDWLYKRIYAKSCLRLAASLAAKNIGKNAMCFWSIRQKIAIRSGQNV
jgi:hypothetical protein